MFINPQSEYYSVSKLNNIFNTTQGEGISLFHCNIRSLTKNLTPSNGVLCSLDSTPDIVATVKPVLSGHRIKRTPSIKRTVAEVPKFISLIYFK